MDPFFWRDFWKKSDTCRDQSCQETGGEGADAATLVPRSRRKANFSGWFLFSLGFQTTLLMVFTCFYWKNVFLLVFVVFCFLVFVRFCLGCFLVFVGFSVGVFFAISFGLFVFKRGFKTLVFSVVSTRPRLLVLLKGRQRIMFYCFLWFFEQILGLSHLFGFVARGFLFVSFFLFVVKKTKPIGYRGKNLRCATIATLFSSKMARWKSEIPHREMGKTSSSYLSKWLNVGRSPGGLHQAIGFLNGKWVHKQTLTSYLWDWWHSTSTDLCCTLRPLVVPNWFSLGFLFQTTSGRS